MANTRAAGYSNSKNYQRKLQVTKQQNLEDRLTELEQKVTDLLSQSSSNS